MSELTRATTPMCPKCGVELVIPDEAVDYCGVNYYECGPCGAKDGQDVWYEESEIYWGYYPVDVSLCEGCAKIDAGIKAIEKELAERFPDGYHPRNLVADASEVATKLRRFAGRQEWEFDNGERADLRSWADELEGKKCTA